MKVKSLSSVQLFATPWTVAHQAPLSMGFSRQEYWSRLPFPSPGDLPDPEIKLRSPTLQADSLPSEPPGKPNYYNILYTTYSLYTIIDLSVQFSLVHSLSRVRLFATPWIAARQASLSITISRPSSPWCHPTISSWFDPSPPAPNLSQHQSLFQWVISSHEVSKVLELQLWHHSFHKSI